MVPARKAALDAIAALPDSSSMLDVLYRVQVVARVLEGIEDAEAGRTISTEELLEQIDSWGK